MDEVQQISTMEETPAVPTPSPDPTPKKKTGQLERLQSLEAQRTVCMTSCRNTITELSDNGKLKRANVETLFSNKVSSIRSIR